MTSSAKQDKLIKRKIRAAIYQALLDKTSAGANVFSSRSVPTQYEEGQLILIYSWDEDISRFNEAPKDYKRVLQVKIECINFDVDDEDLDTALETMQTEVETLIERDETFGKLADRTILTGTRMRIDSEGQSSGGVLTLDYEVTYYTDALRLEDSDLEFLNSVHAELGLGQNAGKPGVAPIKSDIKLQGEA